MSTARSAPDGSRIPLLAAALTGSAILVLYVLTLAPTTSMWDAGEYMAAAYSLGLPHPPGNPLFVLLGRTFSILPIAPTVAQRINLLAALASSVAAAAWFLIAYRVLAAWLQVHWHRLVGAGAAALIGGTAFTVWHQSVVNEKVYTISLAGLAIISWLTVRWLDAPDGPRADRTLILIAYLLGLGYANHIAGLLAGPAVAIAVISRRPRTILRWRLLAVAILALALGVTPFVMQPIRAAHHPPFNTGEPTGCVDGLALDCTLSSTTFERLRDNLDRAQYGKQSVLERQAPIMAQLEMWWLYFRWQWLRDPAGVQQRGQRNLALVFLSLGLLGGWTHWKRHRRSFWYFAPLMGTLTIGLVVYLNFKYGYTQQIQLGLPFDSETTEVRDRDYFYLWSFSAWGVWAAFGLVTVWRALAGVIDGGIPARMPRGRPPMAGSRSLLYAAPVLAIAFIPLATNARWASRAGDTFTRDWAIDLLNSVEPYGILITGGDNDTFPLWYAQEVEGVRRDVTVAVGELLRTDWYPRQIIRRPVFPYDPARGPAIYRNRDWPQPAVPPLAMTIQQADSIDEIIPIPGPQVFRKDSIVATIVGKTSPFIARPFLTRDQIIVLRFIRDSFPERGVYFTTGPTAHELGLTPYLLRQGLVDKLVPRPAGLTPGAVPVEGVGWVDAERTVALWRDVYTAPESLLAFGRWVDEASNTIPRMYAATGFLTSRVLASSGQGAESDSVLATVRDIVAILGLE